MPKPPNDKAIADATVLLLQGEGVREVAKKTGLSRSTVSRLNQKLNLETPERPKMILAEKQRSISELVEGMVRASIEGCKRIAAKTEDEAWMKEQNAFTLSALYRELGDKSIRILEAAERAQERQRQIEAETAPVDPA